MLAGVSTGCLYPKPLEECLYDLAVNGVSGIEIFINTHSELKKKFANAAADLLKRFDVRCFSVHPFTSEMETMMLFSAYERRMEDILEYYKNYFEFMNIVGAEVLVFHGAKACTSKELYCERFSRLYRLGREYGVTVAVENVVRCLSGSSAYIRDISKMLGEEFAFVLDTKQAIRSGEDPFRFVDAAGSRIVLTHVSDSSEMGDCMLIGRGSFRFRQFFEKISKLNPECGVILELYRSAFGGISDLVSAYNTLNNMVK